MSELKRKKGYTSVDTNVGIVFDVQVDVFLNTEAKVTSIRKVALL